MKNISKALLITSLAFILQACTQLFFFPMKQHTTNPGQYNFEYQSVWLTSHDSTQLHAWYIPSKSIKAKGDILFLHGNAENISMHFQSMLWLINKGYNVLALDYRGYGLSQGRPTLPQVFDDIDVALEWLRKDAEKNNIPHFIFSQSLGASLAIKYLELNPSSREKLSGLIAEAGFTRYGNIARHVASKFWLTWTFQYPIQWVITAQYDPVDAIQHLSPLPILLIHSREDQVIPYSHAQSLYDNAQAPRQLHETVGSHIHGVADASTREAILQFLAP